MKKLLVFILRIILTIMGIGLFAVFALPLASGILNVGNTVGMAVGALIGLFGFFMPSVISALSQIWKKGSGKTIIIAVATAAFIIAITFSVTLSQIISYGKYTADNQNTVIVLGCRVNGNSPSLALLNRTKSAAKYLKSHSQAKAVLSGGQGADEDISEAECMRRLMIEYGIDENRLYIEDKSTSTDENISFSKKIIEKYGLDKNVAVATSDYHQKRASMICKKYSIKNTSIPSSTLKYAQPTFYVREVFGVWATCLGR